MSETATSVAFLHSTYEEALNLTRAARDYLTAPKPDERARLSPEANLVASCESMRMTARLTQVMAWLLVQRAVEAGEIARGEATQERYRLAGQTICAASDPVAGEILPPALNRLLEESLALYHRVARLDAMLDTGNDS